MICNVGVNYLGSGRGFPVTGWVIGRMLERFPALRVFVLVVGHVLPAAECGRFQIPVEKEMAGPGTEVWEEVQLVERNALNIFGRYREEHVGVRVPRVKVVVRKRDGLHDVENDSVLWDQS